MALTLVVSFYSVWAIVGLWSRAPRRLIVFRAIATTFTIVVVLIIVELPALAGMIDYNHILRLVTGEWSGPATHFETDPDLSFRRPRRKFWSGRPRSDMAAAWNLPIRSETEQRFTTDSQGYRNLREITAADIALIGDSYIEGAYVSDDETCAVALERLTGRPVVNLGVSGYGSLQQLKVLERHALPLGPRLIAWFFFEGNDLYDDQEYENAILYRYDGAESASAGLELDWSNFGEVSFVANSFRLFRRMCHPLVPNSVATFGWFRDERGQQHRLYFYGYGSMRFDDFERGRLEKTANAFRQGKAICDREKIKLVAFFIPMKFRVYDAYCTYHPESPCREWEPWELPDRFRELCEGIGVPLVDLTGPMRRAAESGKLLYAPEDSHWNRRGHEFVAELVRDQWED